MYDRHDLLSKACTERGLVYSAKEGIFNNICTLDGMPSIFIRDKLIFSSVRVLH
jgi:hypothetical protein